MVVKLTSTPSMRLQRDGNVLESLNTHHSFGMKYVDPNLIIYIIKTAQQFLSTELRSTEGERGSRSTGRSHNDTQQPRHLFGSFVISAQHYFSAYKLHILSAPQLRLGVLETIQGAKNCMDLQ